MGNESKTHWRTVLMTDHLAGDELDGDVTVEINRYEIVKVYSKEEHGKIDKFVIYFKGQAKGMIVTKRKAEAISEALGSPKIEDWIGGRIVIFPKKETHFGKTFPVINVKKAKKIDPLTLIRVSINDVLSSLVKKGAKESDMKNSIIEALGVEKVKECNNMKKLESFLNNKQDELAGVLK